MATMQVALWVIIFLVALALVFDFMNGFHDAANSIATVVSTGVLRPGQAVVFAAFFNFIAIFIFHLSVAATVGKGIAAPGVVDVYVVFGALCGAITWNIVTWYYGIPSSSSHALIGGIVGAVLAKAGAGALVTSGIIRTVAFIFVSPLLGFVLGSLMMVLVAWVCRRTAPARVDRWFRRLQLVSAGAYSLGHGGNDAQKTIGIIWMLLLATGYADLPTRAKFELPRLHKPYQQTQLAEQIQGLGQQLADRGHGCPLQVQLRMLNTLLATATDPVLPPAWRQLCLLEAQAPLHWLSALLAVHDPLALQAVECAFQRARRQLQHLT